MSDDGNLLAFSTDVTGNRQYVLQVKDLRSGTLMSEAMPLKDPELVSNRNPERAWCEAKPNVLCIQSRYQLEGKLPTGIMLANKLKDEGKKIADFMEFQSELRVIPPEGLNQAALARLTGLATPVRRAAPRVPDAVRIRRVGGRHRPQRVAPVQQSVE